MSAPGTFDPGSNSNSSSTGPDNGFIFGIVGGVLGLFLIVAACVAISRRSSGTYYSEGGFRSMHLRTGHFYHHVIALLFWIVGRGPDTARNIATSGAGSGSSSAGSSPGGSSSSSSSSAAGHDAEYAELPSGFSASSSFSAGLLSVLRTWDLRLFLSRNILFAGSLELLIN